MKIKAIKIKNSFGISEIELTDKSLELIGNNGTGKSSILDAIKLGLTNESNRPFIVKKGEKESEIFIEMNDGLTIDRKKRENKSDYKSIKKDNVEISSPESFLKEIFTPLQLNPVEFLSMSEKEQNKILLNLIKFDKDKKEFIKQNFGELPSWVDYDNSILEILNRLQDKNGGYYQAREDVNRQIKAGNAIIQDILKDIPENYDKNKWRNYNLSEKYAELNKSKDYNFKIDKSINYKENYYNTVNGLKGELDSKLAEIFINKSKERDNITTKIEELKKQIASYEKDLENLDNKYDVENVKAQAEYDKKVAEMNDNIKIANEWAAKEHKDVDSLSEELAYAEKMIKHLNEFERAENKKVEVDNLVKTSQSLTDKIELARNLPGVILSEAELPIKSLSIENGIPLINGLPISNLSEGEKLRLCVEVTLSKENNLKLILIDGVEKLSKTNREELYKICKENGIQVISTRTADKEELIQEGLITEDSDFDENSILMYEL